MPSYLRLMKPAPKTDTELPDLPPERPPTKKLLRHSALVATMATAAITAVELKHAGHIVAEPFAPGGTLADYVAALWAMSDGGLTGWLVWVGVIVAAGGAALRWVSIRVASLLKRRSRNS
jgi:hypothetical protein